MQRTYLVVPRRGVNMATAALLSILAVGFDQSPPHPPPSHPPLAPTAPGCEGGCFFISEYVEPADSSQDGFLELYNGCEQRVNLRDYSLLLCRDGCDSAEGMAGSDGIPSGALPVSLSTTDSYINPGSLFSIVYCVEVHTSKCANHNLISLASSFFGDLGDGNGAQKSRTATPTPPQTPTNACTRLTSVSSRPSALPPRPARLRLARLVLLAVGLSRRPDRHVGHVHGGARLGCGRCGGGDPRPSPHAQVRHLAWELR